MVLSSLIILTGNSRWDTAGQEGYEDARRVCYAGTDVLLISFSLVEPDSLHNVIYLWAKEANLGGLKNVPVSQSLFPSPNLKSTSVLATWPLSLK